jgi:hypothetical protein
MNNRQTNSNRPTAQQQAVAAELAALGTMISELGADYERDAANGGASWSKIEMLYTFRARAVEILAAERMTPNASEAEVQADVLAEANRRA